MYKIMIADDEGIVIEALKFIIEKNFGDTCMIQSAKTGRSVIELAENFRPDIAFMDIQMPGINGIEAMKEIRKENTSVIFIILSAFNQFDYAKEAINLDVMAYMNKPIEQTQIVDVLKRAMKKIDDEKARRSNDLKIKEKLEMVVPFIESGFIYSVLFQENFQEDTDNYKQLLSIEENSGFMMVIECGESEHGHMTNTIGSSVRAQNFYPQLRSIVKESFGDSVVGTMMANKVIVFTPAEELPEEQEYEWRIRQIETAREMVRQLKKTIELSFRVGIGYIREMDTIGESYREALKALQYGTGSVAHAKDLPLTVAYDEDYPIETENRLFETVSRGEVEESAREAQRFFDWMAATYPDMDTDIRLKTLEFVLWAEKLVYQNGGKTYHFSSRHEYLQAVNTAGSYEELKQWMVEKITAASRSIAVSKEESNLGIIEKAKAYIRENYGKDICLDDVSRQVNISPYYFSKLFKAETGTNFIEYLTDIRIEKAKEMLSDKNYSMKEICAAIGYSDPNYFSRTFKKNVGVTPTDYREQI